MGFYDHLYVDTFTDTFSQRFASLLEIGAEDNKRVVNERKLRSTATLVAVAMRFTIEKIYRWNFHHKKNWRMLTVALQ